MKDYLSSTERDEFVSFIHMLTKSKSFISKTNTFTKEEITNFKKTLTWGYKAMKSVTLRQNPSSKRALDNMILNTNIILDYKTMLETIAKKKETQLEAAYEDNKEYYKLVELIFHHNCKGCSKEHLSCDFYHEFEKRFIPEFDDWEKSGPCKYSFVDE